MKKQNFLKVLGILLLMLLCVFGFTACPTDDTKKEDTPTDNDDTIASGLRGKLLILHAYGTGDAGGAGANHSFVELYNNSGDSINLTGINLWYANGTRPAANDDPETEIDETAIADKDESWSCIELSKTLPAKTSFLILGSKKTSGRMEIPDSSGDIISSSMVLGNRSFKVALVYGKTQLTDEIQNPFNTDGTGTKIKGYIDMAGAMNNPSATLPDQILGFETAAARNSGSEGIRRVSLSDTDNNANDFESIRYAADGNTAIPENAINIDELFEFFMPKNMAYGDWEPMNRPEPDLPPPPPSTEGLMIFQVHGTGFDFVLPNAVTSAGNDNTGTGSISHSFIELYNNSDTAIPLTGFSVQWANGKANGGGTVIEEDEDWNVIELDKSIPAYGSYLIRGMLMNNENGNVGRLQIAVCDKDVPDFEMSNRSFKVALVSNTTKLTMSAPWDNAAIPTASKVPALVDLVGARNGSSDSVQGFKGAIFATYSKQQAIRRVSLVDTNDNSKDYTGIDYRTASLDNKPRSITDGTWHPFGE